MAKFCEYRSCHNLGSSSFNGYCNEQHRIRGEKDEQKQLEEQIAAAKEKAAAKKDEGHTKQSSKTVD